MQPRPVAFQRSSSNGVETTLEEDLQRIEWHQASPKKFAVFLSHHKAACATEARFVKEKLEVMFKAPVFLGK